MLSRAISVKGKHGQFFNFGIHDAAVFPNERI